MDINCFECGLFKNQLPLHDQKNSGQIMLVGLSAKKIMNVHMADPLSNDIRSGKLINKIEKTLDQFSFIKSNLVKCVPLSEKRTIRYPRNYEMDLCYGHFLKEIHRTSPKLVFMLGLVVSNFLLSKMSLKINSLDNKFNYPIIRHEAIYYIPIHHPSFISVNKQKDMDKYVDKIKEISNRLL